MFEFLKKLLHIQNKDRESKSEANLKTGSYSLLDTTKSPAVFRRLNEDDTIDSDVYPRYYLGARYELPPYMIHCLDSKRLKSEIEKIGQVVTHTVFICKDAHEFYSFVENVLKYDYRCSDDWYIKIDQSETKSSGWMRIDAESILHPKIDKIEKCESLDDLVQSYNTLVESYNHLQDEFMLMYSNRYR